MNRRMRIFLPLIVLAVGVVIAVLIARAKPEVEKVTSTPPPPLVETVMAERGATRFDVVSQGTVMPRAETTLVAQVAGRVQWVSPSFAEGGFFGRGDVLLRLEPADYELAVSQAEAMVAQATSRLELATAEAEVAREEWDDLGNGGEANALVLHKPQLAEARAALKAAEASFEKAQLDLRRTRITVPFTGRVSRQQVNLGQYVAPGTPLATIYGTEVAEVRLSVSQSDLEFLDISLGESTGEGGPEVLLRANLAGQAAEWSARVVRTGGSLDARTRMIDLIARVDDPFRRRAGSAGQPLPMGLFVEAEIGGRAAEGVFELPRAALREGQRMMVVEDGERLVFRQIEVARTQGETVVVRSGLEDGDAVVVSPMVAAVDGMKVRVAGAPEKEGVEEAPS